MNHRDSMMMVCPQDLRFTQNSIKNTFKPPHESQRIDDAVKRIQKKLLSASDFPPMNVVDHNNILWCLDNRRLWIFRQARVPAVKVNLVPQDFSRRSEEFFLNLDPRLEKRYSRPTYFPRVRGPVEFQYTPAPKTDHPSPETSQKPRRPTVAEAKKTVPKETCHVAEEPPLQHKTSMMMVCPQDLRFTCDYVKNTLDPPNESVRIDYAVNLLRKKLLSPSHFLTINVVEHKNILWCLENGTLWVFRVAGVPAVKVNLVPQKFSRKSEEFFLNLTPSLEELFSRPTYLPRVIGPVEFQDTAPPNTDHPSPSTSQRPRRTTDAEEPPFQGEDFEGLGIGALIALGVGYVAVKALKLFFR